MRILITGAEGFIGGHLARELSLLGHEVILHRLTDGDLKDRDSLSKYSSIDYIYHLAGMTFVPDSWTNTFSFFENNVISTLTVLEYCRSHMCGVTVMSTYLYGAPKYLPVDENHPISPASPYHETKVLIESMAEFYANAFGLNISIIRPFNVYGKGQNKSFLIPKIVDQLLDPNVKEVVVNDLEPKRDYVYIKDVVAILCKVCNDETKGAKIYNIGSGHSLSVKDVIDIAESVTGIRKEYKEIGEKRKGEIPDCYASIEKVTKCLGYNEFYSLEEGLRDWLVE